MAGLSSFSVYTILHKDRLARIAASARPTKLHETKRWVTAGKLFAAARRAGETVPILFADAAYDASKLLYWGHLKEVNVAAGGTTFTVTGLTALKEHRTQELLLLSTGKPVADGYQRPYAVISTPTFLPQPAPAGSVTLFSFGYWGNGSATRTLVEAIDAAERHRHPAAKLVAKAARRRGVDATGRRMARWRCHAAPCRSRLRAAPPRGVSTRAASSSANRSGAASRFARHQPAISRACSASERDPRRRARPRSRDGPLAGEARSASSVRLKYRIRAAAGPRRQAGIARTRSTPTTSAEPSAAMPPTTPSSRAPPGGDAR